MQTLPARVQGVLPPETAAFYQEALRALRDSKVPHLVGGSYAFEQYTGIARHTKDLDVFLRARDIEAALEALDAIGCRTERTFPHWLGKAFRGDDFVDLIYSSGNGVAEVDDAWFEHAKDGEVFGVRTRLCPAEEMIWSKGFLMERERYDGADVAHLIHACYKSLCWGRILARFGPHWRVLLAHLILFGFVYPSDRSRIPAEVMGELLRRLQGELIDPPARGKVCQGTLISREQYLVDVERWGFRDARLNPEVKMSAEDIDDWTRAIGDK